MKRTSSKLRINGPLRSLFCTLFCTLSCITFVSTVNGQSGSGSNGFSGLHECVELHDSLTLCYTYAKASKSKPRALIVTLPMMGRERGSFDGIASAISERFENIAFLNFDMRGHGLSTSKGVDTVSYRTMEKSEFTRMPHDIKEAMRLIRNRHKELRRAPVVVIGASIGANTAGTLANIEDRVKAAALLSPGIDYRGITPGPHLKMTDEKSILFMVGKSDTYSYTSADSLFHLTAGAKTLHVYNTASHGTNIPNNNSQALEDLLNWLDRIL